MTNVDMIGNVGDKTIVPKLIHTPEGRFPTTRVGNFAASHLRIYLRLFYLTVVILPNGRPPCPSEDDRSSLSKRSQNPPVSFDIGGPIRNNITCSILTHFTEGPVQSFLRTILESAFFPSYVIRSPRRTLNYWPFFLPLRRRPFFLSQQQQSVGTMRRAYLPTASLFENVRNLMKTGAK
jgi:hypothetical protein